MSGTAVYKQIGDTVPYTPSSAVSAGDVVVQGELVGIAQRDIAANAAGDLIVAGVVTFPKATTSGSAITAGAKLYWDESSSVATTTVGSNKLIGKAVTAASASASTVDVLMSQ